jgi:uncharacterized protein (TIGR01319 family)
MARDADSIRVIVATDCGSTTTKAILIEERDGVFRQVSRGEAPTTVEAPFEDVTKGVLNAITELEELSGRPLLDEAGRILTPAEGDRGTDVYISTSSAGGGLQMMVTGVVKTMTAESAARAALGAGAIVMDVIASNDRRLPHEQVERIRRLRPDMILLSGGTDGGAVEQVVQLAELVAAANPRPRLGSEYKLPVIFAGNASASGKIEETLAEHTDLQVVENLRPVLERENLGPAREKIHDLFMEHVMAQAPGYRKLMEMTHAPIMPTPGAVGLIIQTVAERDEIDVLGVDIGGATTDVFSVFGGEFNRTVSANLGMSYSVSNVFAEAGLDNVMRWVPFEMEESDLRNRVKNKMIRPTTIPQSLQELVFEQAIAREALRLAFAQSEAGATIVDMMSLDLLVGSGGVLSHAPRRNQSMLMLIDAFAPEGVTRLAVDSIFMMPQLGVLSTVQPRAATEVFEKDCLIHLGTVVAPIGEVRDDREALRYEIHLPGGTKSGSLQGGALRLFALGVGEVAQVVLMPAKGLDVGAGPGNELRSTLHGGVVGVVLDTRGRPFALPKHSSARVRCLETWMQTMNMYPESLWHRSGSTGVGN